MGLPKDWIKIQSATSIDAHLARLCECALENDAFQPCWIMPNGDYVISFMVDASAYIGVIRAQEGDGLEDALLIIAVYRAGSHEMTDLIRTLKSEYPKLH